MAKVTNQLYISDYAFAANHSLLQQHGITHIVNMAYEYDNAFPDKFVYLHIPAKDVLAERLGPWFHSIAAFVTEAKKSDGLTLIHCQLGVSRSATAVIASLIINDGMQLSQAFRLLKNAKHDVEPNATFLKELRVLETAVHGKCSLDKLTFMDKCEEPAPLDWKESLAIILASAALSDMPYSKHSRELDCITADFNLARADTTELETLITNVLITGLESFGGGSERDKRARAALGNMLAVHLPQRGIITVPQLKQMLFNVLCSDDFVDFIMDVPKGNAWVKELYKSMNRGPADPGELRLGKAAQGQVGQTSDVDEEKEL